MKKGERYKDLEEEQKALGGFTDADADKAMYESEMKENEEEKSLIQPQITGDIRISLRPRFDTELQSVSRVNVKIINSSKNKLPEMVDVGSAGCDLRAYLPNGDIVIKPQTRRLVGTGIHIQMPIGFEAQVRSRSGLAWRKGIFVLNGVGTIDSTYRGDIGVILYNSSDAPFIIANGDRIAQLVIAPYTIPKWCSVDELDETERGDGGFGHSGIK